MVKTKNIRDKHPSVKKKDPHFNRYSHGEIEPPSPTLLMRILVHNHPVPDENDSGVVGVPYRQDKQRELHHPDAEKKLEDSYESLERAVMWFMIGGKLPYNLNPLIKEIPSIGTLRRILDKPYNTR